MLNLFKIHMSFCLLLIHTPPTFCLPLILCLLILPHISTNSKVHKRRTSSTAETFFTSTTESRVRGTKISKLLFCNSRSNGSLLKSAMTAVASVFDGSAHTRTVLETPDDDDDINRNAFSLSNGFCTPGKWMSKKQSHVLVLEA
jgi:hypothetical protein